MCCLFMRKKNKEEMKELVKQGRKFLEGEKDFIRSKKEFKEKLQLLSYKKKRKQKKKEKRNKRERKEEKRRW